MPCCVFRMCKTYTGTAVKTRKDVSFHLFPKNGLIKEKWIRVVRKQRREDDWMPTSYSAICSQHFKESEKYVTKQNVRKLKNKAVPILKKENVGEGIISEDDSLKDVYILDHDSIFDTPRKTYLKNKITKMSEAKQKLQMKNYNLTKQNKRLKEKYSNLQKVVSKLKKKKYFTIDQLTELKLKAEAVDLSDD